MITGVTIPGSGSINSFREPFPLLAERTALFDKQGQENRIRRTGPGEQDQEMGTA
jgi:hypothetical protein